MLLGLLPWHEDEQMQLQEIQQPAVIETSKCANLVIRKACKSFENMRF